MRYLICLGRPEDSHPVSAPVELHEPAGDAFARTATGVFIATDRDTGDVVDEFVHDTNPWETIIL